MPEIKSDVFITNSREARVAEVFGLQCEGNRVDKILKESIGFPSNIISKSVLNKCSTLKSLTEQSALLNESSRRLA
jgi:hypothetical protein